MSLEQRFAEAMGQHLGPDFPSDIALAVSGGGDSMAMLTLAHNWAHRWGVNLHGVTVDHGLRPESASEAALVADECASLGHPHTTLHWHWDGQGNLMEAARNARLDLINTWRDTIAHVLMGHTQDDVAETLVMRLLRGSGVDGLSAMAAKRFVPSTQVGNLVAQSTGFWIVRPCLEMGRAELRHYLSTLQGRWVDDPTNENDAYERARVRKQIAALGLDNAALARSARRLAQSKEALQVRAKEIWDRIGMQTDNGDLIFDRTGFDGVDHDTQCRLLSSALRFVATTQHGPRSEPLASLLDRILGGGGGTLHGCEIRHEGPKFRVFREWKAVADQCSTAGDTHLWDGRWIFVAQGLDRMTIRALGEEGWAQISDRSSSAVPFHAAKALPSIWDGDSLVACDALGVGPGTTFRLASGEHSQKRFASFLLSH